MKYCDDHACWHDGICKKCYNNEQGHVRHITEVNPSDKKRIKDLRKRGLMK